MRLKTITLLVPAAALLAACSDSPTAARSAGKSLYDMSSVTITRGPGKEIPADRQRQAAPPRFLCTIDGECTLPPKPMADYDYWSSVSGSTSGYSKLVDMYATSWGGTGITSMSLTAHFKSVGGQGSQGCSATPQQFEQETVTGTTGTISSERFASYPSNETWVWGVDGDHAFTTTFGYSLDGERQRSGTFYSSARLCY
ncbi:hypothetical protein [Longimicrobium sp.]|uniref:hypothetical protein n=1 Tax=Longimicrobium sp. TaxID=2029185 RepID=UPI002CA9C715|nr:hypothetical protein [Longimicrobium sp.]HSU13015.1 hypothetical protein [Longimicrobium sp.]